MPVWTDRVKEFVLQDSIILGQTSRYLQVNITRADSNALPLSNATVVLYKKANFTRLPAPMSRE